MIILLQNARLSLFLILFSTISHHEATNGLIFNSGFHFTILYYWKCYFPMSFYSFGWSVCHIFNKVALPCSYRSTCFSNISITTSFYSLLFAEESDSHHQRSNPTVNVSTEPEQYFTMSFQTLIFVPINDTFLSNKSIYRESLIFTFSGELRNFIF